MALPGTPGQRISDLCNGNHITQKELAEKIGVSASQLSRIVSGETRTVSSDILIGVAKEFKVSTDYILGLSTVSVRKSYDISELGLSEGAVRGLVTGAVDVQILNHYLLTFASSFSSPAAGTGRQFLRPSAQAVRSVRLSLLLHRQWKAGFASAPTVRPAWLGT